MAEWFVQEGIGEHRALLKDGFKILAAKLEWPGELVPGQVEDAVLVKRERQSPRGLARFDSGEEALVDRLPRDASEGARMRFLVTRTAFREIGRSKLAQVRPTDETPREAPSLAERLDAKIVTGFYRDDWHEIWDSAWNGRWQFLGGEMTFSLTPAMTLIDVDGDLPPRALALAAAQALSKAVRFFDLGGSIGVDFPTLPSKSDRKEVDGALGEALADWPHERTAMNGFGFVQIVTRMERPSMLHRLHFDRPGAAARLAINHAADLRGPGITQIVGNPAVLAAMQDNWLEELRLRSARPVELKADAALALTAWHAQIVQR